MCQNFRGGFALQTFHTLKFISLDQNTSISNINHVLFTFLPAILYNILGQMWYIMLKWTAVKVVITCISKHFSMYDIFRTTHRLTMIFSSKCRLNVIWQVLNTFRTIEYSTGPMRTHKEATNSTAKFGSKMAELKTPKIAHETKNWIFSKSKISIHQSNHVKRYIKSMIFRP